MQAIISVNKRQDGGRATETEVAKIAEIMRRHLQRSVHQARKDSLNKAEGSPGVNSKESPTFRVLRQIRPGDIAKISFVRADESTTES